MNTYKKYPRTPHLPWSRGKTDDDKVLKNTDHFNGMHVVVTEKMDGECTTMYSDHIHARSIDSANHYSRNWVKGFHGSIKHLIPNGWRICGENLYAEHSIAYDNLESYFYGFGVYDNNNICLDWEMTITVFDELGITPVPNLYTGEYLEFVLLDLSESLNPEITEGYVVRNYNSFNYDDFGKNVAKYVRKGHVQTDTHWMHKDIKPNKLR